MIEGLTSYNQRCIMMAHFKGQTHGVSPSNQLLLPVGRANATRNYSRTFCNDSHSGLWRDGHVRNVMPLACSAECAIPAAWLSEWTVDNIQTAACVSARESHQMHSLNFLCHAGHFTLNRVGGKKYAYDTILCKNKSADPSAAIVVAIQPLAVGQEPWTYTPYPVIFP